MSSYFLNTTSMGSRPVMLDDEYTSIQSSARERLELLHNSDKTTGLYQYISLAFLPHYPSPIKSIVVQSEQISLEVLLRVARSRTKGRSMLLSQGQFVGLIWMATMLIYVSPLLLTRTSGNWDFWYIWDDRDNFVKNEVLQSSLSFQTFYKMFTMVKINVYEPLGWILKYLIVQTVGLDAWWVRLVSIVIHFGAGFVLAKVSGLVLDIDYMLTEMKRPRSNGLELRQRRKQSHHYFRACCLSAAVFLVHPVQVEVVAWPSAQPYTLAALFSYWSLLVHVKNIHQTLSSSMGEEMAESPVNKRKLLLKTLVGDGARSSGLLSSVLYLCALLSKSASLPLPTGLFLIDVWMYQQLSSQNQTITVKHIRLYAAKMLPSVTILLVFVLVTAYSNSEGAPDVISLSVGERVLKAMNSPVWILRCFVWPAKMRPHYQIQPGDLSLGNSECLLSSATAIFTLALTIRNSWNRGVSKHTLALAFSISMLMPVSGLIRHGLITTGANRYAYLPTIIVVPYGGWVFARYLLQETNPQIASKPLTAPAWDMPEREVSRYSRQLKQSKRVHKIKLLDSSRTYTWGIFLLLTGTLLAISTDLLTQWRNEDSLFQYSLRMDPADWKILGQRGEYLQNAGRCTRDNTACRNHWILAKEFSPRGTLKSQLYRLHLQVALGDVDRACDEYIALLKDNSGNSSVHNNAAVCFTFRGMLTAARREFSLALRFPAKEDEWIIHANNARDFEKWESERMRHSPDEFPGFVGTMTY